MLRFFDFMGVDKARMATLYEERPFILRQAIRLTQLSRIFIAILMLHCAFYLLADHSILDLRTKMFTLPLLACTIGLLIWTCHLFETGKERAGRYLLTAVIVASTIVSVVFCGGFLEGRFTAILLFPMVLAFAILPMRAAIWYFGAAIFIPLGIDIALRAGRWQIPDFTSSADPWVHQLIIMGTVSVSVFFCLAHMKEVQRHV